MTKATKNNRPQTHDDFHDFTGIRYLDELAEQDWMLCDGAYYLGDGVSILPDGTWVDEDEDEDNQ